MEHTKGILLECNLSEEEINTVIEALSRDYVAVSYTHLTLPTILLV